MLNKVILMGRLTADPDLRYTPSNVPVASFTLAVQRRNKNDDTDFIDIVAWDKNAEFVSKWFGKGRMVAVVGRLQIRNWKDKEGHNRRTAEVIADECHFAEPKSADAMQSAPRQTAYPSENAYPDEAPRQAPARPAPPSRDGYAERPVEPAPAYNEVGFSELLDDDEELPF